MYTDINFKSKAAAKRAIADGTQFGCYPPGLGSVPENGTCSVEGPWFPAAHTWYGTATLKDGVVVKLA